MRPRMLCFIRQTVFPDEPVSLLLSWIFTSASRVSLTQGFDFDIAGIVQSVILFSIAIPLVVTAKQREARR